LNEPHLPQHLGSAAFAVRQIVPPARLRLDFLNRLLSVRHFFSK